MTEHLFYYKVLEVISAYDADTLRVIVDFGFKTYAEKSCRLGRINALEMRDPDPELKAKAYEARDYLRARLETAFAEGVPVVIHSLKLEKYGRALVELYVGDANINDELLERGYATPYG